MATLTGIGWNVHNKTYASGYESNSLLGRGNWVRIDSSLQSASQIATQIKGWAVAGFGIMLLLAQEGGSVTSDNVVGKVRDIAIACSSLGYYPDVLEVYNEANTSGANAVTYSRVVADCTRIRAFAYQFLPNKPLIYAGSMASYDVRAGWDVELWFSPMIAAGLLDVVDGICMHFYPVGGNGLNIGTDPTEGGILTGDPLNDIPVWITQMRLLVPASVPIYCSEVGYSTALVETLTGTTWDADAAAGYYYHAVQAARTTGIPICLYDTYGGASDTGIEMLDSSWSAKQMLNTFNSLASAGGIVGIGGAG